MEQRPLGQDGPVVGPVCLGCMFFGTRVAEDEAFAILDRFVDRGGRFLDTADNYAFWVEGGTGDESELLLGRWLASRGIRDELVLATKAGARPTLAGAGPETREGLSARALARALEGSLRRLRTDRVDLWYAHVDDRAIPQEVTLRAFTAAVAAGDARAIGASNFRAWRLALALDTSARDELASYCCVQQRWSYLRPHPGADLGAQIVVDDELLDLCEQRGLSLLPYSPLLSGAYVREDVDLPPAYRTVDNEARLRALRRVAGDRGVSPNHVVLAWLRQSSGRDVVPVIAASSVAQLDENLDALELRLTGAELDALDTAVCTAG
jgi:aryl-alcohol dehydrogenase-like predicted oxidoreductase